MYYEKQEKYLKKIDGCNKTVLTNKEKKEADNYLEK